MGILLLVIVVAAGAWWVEVRMHPIRRCPSCGGSKRNSANENRWGKCRRCDGQGEIRRFGARGE